MPRANKSTSSRVPARTSVRNLHLHLLVLGSDHIAASQDSFHALCGEDVRLLLVALSPVHLFPVFHGFTVSQRLDDGRCMHGVQLTRGWLTSPLPELDGPCSGSLTKRGGCCDVIWKHCSMQFAWPRDLRSNSFTAISLVTVRDLCTKLRWRLCSHAQGLGEDLVISRMTVDSSK